MFTEQQFQELFHRRHSLGVHALNIEPTPFRDDQPVQQLGVGNNVSVRSSYNRQQNVAFGQSESIGSYGNINNSLQLQPLLLGMANASNNSHIMASIAALHQQYDNNKRPATSSVTHEENKRAKIAPAMPSTSSNETVPEEASTSCSISFQSKPDLWNLRMSELRHFVDVYGHCVVPHNYEKSQPLAQWTKRQRYQHKLKYAGKHSTLTGAREQELVDLGFVWDSHAAKWEEKFNDLLAFKAREGHCNVPITSKDLPKLAIWVKCQRRMYMLRNQGQQTGMTDERIRRLEGAGFIFLPRQK